MSCVGDCLRDGESADHVPVHVQRCVFAKHRRKELQLLTCVDPRRDQMTLSARKRQEVAAQAAKAADKVHGVRTAAVNVLDTAASALCIEDEGLSDVARWRKEQVEQVYARSKVPLGAAKSHGVQLPPQLASGQLAFGACTQGAQQSAKDVIWPQDTAPAAPIARLEPGYRANQGAVDWSRAAVQPDAGFGSKPGTRESAADAFRDPMPVSTASAARVADFKQRRASMLAGAVQPPVSKQQTADDGIDAGALLRGCGLTAEQVQPDANVGRAVHSISPPPVGPNHVFGVATVRGELAPISTLISPGALDAFIEPLSASELADVLSACGLSLPQHTFDSLFAKAAQMDNLLGGDTVRVATFQNVRSQACV